MDLKELIDQAGHTTRSYSGRGMNGKKCLAVYCDDVYEFIADMIETVRADEGYLLDLASFVRDMRTETLGRRMVAYWPDIPYKEEEDK